MAVVNITAATDELFIACDYAGTGGGPDWAYLTSYEASCQRASLACCLFYLTTHLRAGPA